MPGVFVADSGLLTFLFRAAASVRTPRTGIYGPHAQGDQTSVDERNVARSFAECQCHRDFDPDSGRAELRPPQCSASLKTGLIAVGLLAVLTVSISRKCLITYSRRATTSVD